MEYGVGDIVEGHVTGITKFGAFVAYGEGKSGLVHISEVAGSYVKEVSDYLTIGQEVKVKILSVDENGRISLSIKKALPQEPHPMNNQARGAVKSQEPQTPEVTFEDKLKAFMQDSQSRMSDMKRQSDRKSGSSRPRRRG